MSQVTGYVETYTGVYATPEFVGRKELIARISEAIRDISRSYIIYITGEGGIGKTRLVKHILQHLPEDVKVLSASDLIDLYHTPARTVAGLVDNIQRALSPDGDEFPQYRKKRQDLEDLRVRGTELASSQFNELYDAFFFDLAELSKKRRLVLVLDTVEKLFYQKDLVARQLGLTEERSDILDWLITNFCPKVANAVILLSGRPTPDNLEGVLSQFHDDKQLLSFTLHGLTENEALDYFDAVIRGAEKSDALIDIEMASALRKWSVEQKRSIFYCLCKRNLDDQSLTVRPIFLALAIDYLLIEGRPLSVLLSSLKKAQQLTDDQRGEIRDQLGQALVRALREQRRPADELITSLGWLRKGADSELLAEIAEIDLKMVEESFATIKNLSFIKIRPFDKRIFLHDEMYDLLNTYALERQPEPAQKRVFDKLKAYYERCIAKARDEIASLYEEASEVGLPETYQIAAARARLQDALVEDLYYKLRWDPAEGFETYFQYAEEAIVDEDLDMQLRAELLSFLAEHDSSAQAERIEGLRRADVVTDAAIRWIKRLTTAAKRYDDALEVAQHLRTDAAYLIEGGGDLARAALDTWEAITFSYIGEFERAKELLNSEDIARINEDRGKALSLQEAEVLAHAYNNLGYVYRSMGHYHAAVEKYKAAERLWRGTGIDIELANTLNNRAFAQAELGLFDAAERAAKLALDLRKRLGPRAPVGFSLNTLAHIAIRKGDYREAIEYAERALSLFQTIEEKRGTGLALVALAEARRREGDAKNDSCLLTQAAETAEEGVHVFEELKEPSRQVEALIEVGCAYRDLAMIILGPSPRQESLTKEIQYLAFKGGEALKRAAYIAGEGNNLSLQVNAMVNIAWLYYYLSKKEDAKNQLEEVRRIIPSTYYITTNGFVSGESSSAVALLAQLGKIESLEGEIAFDSFLQSDHEQGLPNAIEHYTLSLAYDDIAAGHRFRDMRRVMDRIYNRLKNLDTLSLLKVNDFINDVEEKYHLGKSRMSAFLSEDF